MTINNKRITAAVLAVATTVAGLVNAGPTSTTTLLTAQFETRNVVTIEGGSFHFVPGQDAPVHTHEAPAIGVVTKGTIIYQIEGESRKSCTQAMRSMNLPARTLFSLIMHL